MEIRRVAVIGSGQMGTGVAQVTARAGFETVLFKMTEGPVEAGHVPTYDAAFNTLIAKDAPAYVSRVGLSPLEAVQLIVAHGGVP